MCVIACHTCLLLANARGHCETFWRFAGYVVEAVPLALLVAAQERTRGLASVLERAVALGGDTDTIASIAGQVVAASGVEVPRDLLQPIPGIADVESAVTQFAAVVTGG